MTDREQRPCGQVAVPGVPLVEASSPPYSYLVVGEAPGRTEHVEGLPFVGQAGQFLRNQLTDLLTEEERERVFLTNAFRYWPICSHRVQTPTIEMVRDHRARLREDFIGCQPRSVLTLGRVALFAVTDVEAYHPERRGRGMGALAGGKDPNGAAYRIATELVGAAGPVAVFAAHHPRYVRTQARRGAILDVWRSCIREWASAP